MPTIIRIEDLQPVIQLTTGAIFYTSQSGTPFKTTLSDVLSSINNGTGNFVTSGQLNISGQALENQINSLSGYSNNTFATINNLLLTGQQNFNLIVGLSGSLNQTGTNLLNQINIVSGLARLGGVTGINGVTGGVNLIGQGNVTISRIGQNINISGSNINGVVPSINFTTNIDWSLANTFSASINSSPTFTFSNNIDGKSISILCSGLFSGMINWPGNVKWPNNTTPVPSSGGCDVYTFIQIGSGIFGTVIQNFPL